MSLRWKITLLTTISVLLTLIVSALLVRQIIDVSEDQRLRAEATTSLQQAVKILDETGISVLGAKVNDPQLPQAARDSANSGNTVTYRGKADGVPVVYAAAPVQIGTQPAVLSLSVSWANSLQVRANVDAALFWAGIATLFIVSAFGILVASQLVRRLAHGSTAARSIAAGQDDTVVAHAIGKPVLGKDEVDQFAAAVDAMAAKLNARIASEQRFSADLAHELRTPLTGLVTAASLLPDSRPTELVQDRVKVLRALVEDLLEVSRLEYGGEFVELSRVDLNPCIDEIIERIRDRRPEQCANLKLELSPASTWVWTEPRRLERIMVNLISNASVHGGGEISVRVSGSTIEVSDNGPGFPQSILAAGPTRFVSKGGGIGLGLTIANGQAHALGGQLVLGNPRGARAVVRLREVSEQQVEEETA